MDLIDPICELIQCNQKIIDEGIVGNIFMAVSYYYYYFCHVQYYFYFLFFFTTVLLFYGGGSYH